MKPLRRFEVRRSRIGERDFNKLGILGYAVEYDEGWRFHSNVSSHRSSRRFWPSYEACFPRWTGGLDSTESREVK